MTGINFLKKEYSVLFNYIMSYKDYIYKILKICVYELSNDIIDIFEMINYFRKSSKLKLSSDYLNQSEIINKNVIKYIYNFILYQNKIIDKIKYELNSLDVLDFPLSYYFLKL